MLSWEFKSSCLTNFFLFSCACNRSCLQAIFLWFMDLSTQTIELFCNEVLFAGLIIAGIMVNDPSYDISNERVNNCLTKVHCYLTFP